MSNQPHAASDVPEGPDNPISVRHVMGISGGKDSSALALYMRDRVPQMEYFFCDTGSELPETYEYLQRLETALGKPIARLNADRNFDHWLWVYQGALPSPQMRWCTKALKIKPLEAWIGDSETLATSPSAPTNTATATSPISPTSTRFTHLRRMESIKTGLCVSSTMPDSAFPSTTSGAPARAATSASSSARPSGLASPTVTPTCLRRPSPTKTK